MSKEDLEELDRQGKILESTIRQCEKKAKQNEDNPKLYLAYVDRMLIAMKKKERLADLYLETKKAIEDSENS